MILNIMNIKLSLINGFSKNRVAYQFSKVVGLDRCLLKKLFRPPRLSVIANQLECLYRCINPLFYKKNILLTLILISALFVLLPLTALAYEDDYIWQEIYSRRLPKAKNGNAKAQYEIASMFERGNGVQQSALKAFKWYKKAAKQGHNKAVFKVGLSCLKGTGTKKNYRKALKWFKTAGNKGNVRAFYSLGSMFENGQGVEKDLNLALEWYIKADNGNYPLASERIELVASAIRKEKQQKLVSYKSKLPKKEVTPANFSKVKKKPKKIGVKTILLKGDWVNNNKQALYLPSKLTKCKQVGKNIECLTNRIIRDIGVADIRYTTKALLHGIDESGSFKVSYRNNVLEFNINDEKYLSSGGKLPIKLGWQEKEHKLSCSLHSVSHLECKKNKHRLLDFVKK
jgi:hypothetical protein